METQTPPPVTNTTPARAAHSQLVLSLFPGIDILGMGFEQNGFCVVKSNDIILGSTIETFYPVHNRFDGIIGGSPCQDFSKARRTPPTGYGLKMLAQYARVVSQARPRWYLLENVPQVPTLQIKGYYVQRFELSPLECGGVQNRPRHFQFGSSEGLIIEIHRETFTGTPAPCVTASESNAPNRRTFADVCKLQGLPENFDLPDFTKAGKYKAVGNGVNLHVSRRIAQSISEATARTVPVTIHNTRFCACGCGRRVTARQKSAIPSCRKRIERQRKNPNVFLWNA